MTPRRFALACAAVGVPVLVLVFLLQSGLLQSRSDMLLGRASLVAAAGFWVAAAIWTSRRAPRRGPVRRAWILLAIAAAGWAIGEVIAFWQVLTTGAAATLSLVDVFQFAAPVVAVFGLLSFPTGRRSGRARLQLIVDGTLIGSTLLFIGVSLVQQSEPVEVDLPPADSLLLVMYPVIDLVLSAIALVLIQRGGQRGRSHFFLLCAGFLGYTVGDILLALQAFGYLVRVDDPFVPFWLLGSALNGLAALSPGATTALDPDSQRDRVNPFVATVLVNVPLALALVVGISLVNNPQPLLLATGLIVVLSSVARQLLMELDNLDLRRGLEALVTERTAEVKRLARQSGLVLDAATEGIVGLDRAGRFTFLNPAAEEMFAAGGRDLIGSSIESMYAPGPDGKRPTFARHAMSRPIRTGEEEVGLTTQMVARDGSRFPAEYSVSPVPDRDTGTLLVVTFHDITERTEVEGMKDQFVSMVSHELRTPMTSVRGSLGLLAGGAVGELPPQAAQMVKIALENSERLTRLVNDILEIERIGSGTVPLSAKEHSTAALIEAALHSVQGTADGAGIALRVTRAEGHVYADQDRVVQILTNLIANAINYAPPGGEVRVSAAPEAAERASNGRHEVLFCVSDDGPGIPKESVQRIFERFQKSAVGSGRGIGGTGLGLAICRSLVEAHGGRIWVVTPSNEPAGSGGPGAAFFFTMPAEASGLPSAALTGS